MALIDTVKNALLNLVGKGRRYASDNAEKIDGYVDKVGGLVDQQTKNKYSDKITKAQDAAKKAIREE